MNCTKEELLFRNGKIFPFSNQAKTAQVRRNKKFNLAVME
jgi:hypothetical protein